MAGEGRQHGRRPARGRGPLDSSAIPWLLLAADSTGGVAPAASECNASTAGDVVEVPYTADDYFWKGTDGLSSTEG